MEQPPATLMLIGPWLRWLAWFVAFATITTALLTAEAAEAADEMLPEPAVFPLSKVAHVSAYATLAVLTAFLPVPRRWRWWLLGGLVVHAAGTEFLQLFVPHRTASLRDVGFDLLGLALGVALTWRGWWRE